MDPRIEALFRRSNRGIKFDLERMRTMLRSAGDPQLCAPSVLIAGTNGKGSLTAMWARGLTHDGHRVGAYTSPHLIRVNERIVVAGEPVSDAALGALFDRLAEHEKKVGLELTFFEAMTFMAFCHFADERVTAMALEVGMGGRLDATNVKDPVLGVITTIGLDHMEFLGDTLAAIAREKAGIARPNVPLVFGDLPPEAMSAVRQAAKAALLVELAGRRGAATMHGEHQRHNAALFELSAEVPSVLRLSERAIAEGKQATVRGRYEVIAKAGRRFIVDGAHNGPAMVALRQALLTDPAFRPGTLVFGGTQGRAPQETLLAIEDLFERVIVCEPPTERAIPTSELKQALPRATIAGSVQQAIGMASASSGENVCVTGSLYLVGEALAILDGGGVRDAVSDYR